MADASDEPPVSKLTRSKQRWAREGKFLTGKIARPDEQRLPPGQHLTKDWPVLDLGLTPDISRQRWRLDASILSGGTRSSSSSLSAQLRGVRSSSGGCAVHACR